MSEPSHGGRAPTYEEKREIHKTLLAHLYLKENLKLPKIRDLMQQHHDFRAQTHQYKYRFQKWGWEKSLANAKKQKIIELGQKRAAQGRSTVVRHQKRKIDSKQLLRGFAGWNLPRQYLLRQGRLAQNHTSPFDTSETPPSDISMQSPAGTEAMSPGLSHAVTHEVAQIRAERLLVGDFGSLLRSLDTRGKLVLADWMDQFWTFCFASAKQWPFPGRSRPLVDAMSPARTLESAPPTPLSSGAGPSASCGPSRNTEHNNSGMGLNSGLQRLCGWTVHITSESWEYINEQTSIEAHGQRTDSSPTHSFSQHIHEALQTNQFSNITNEDLPVSSETLSQLLTESSAPLLRESLKFGIMARNIELVGEVLDEAEENNDKTLKDIKPLHLALTYLDGSRSCCHIFRTILQYAYFLECRPDDLGPSGLSLFDTLMLHILRNHTMVTADAINGDMPGMRHFGAEELDSCGRWDATSPEYRRLFKKGGTVPASWKHRFCNTSVQVVCHCLYLLGAQTFMPSSGSLFLRRCFVCGTKMTPSPMHNLVLTAWHVANSRFDGEDLFGMICVFLSIATAFAPRGDDRAIEFAKVELDLALLGINATPATAHHDRCGHDTFTPSELADRLSRLSSDIGTTQSAQGWNVFRRILKRVEDQYRPFDMTDAQLDVVASLRASVDQEVETLASYCIKTFWADFFPPGYQDCIDHLESERGRAFGQDIILGSLWAACQAECLTYRPRTYEDPGHSKNLNIDMIEDLLDTEDQNALVMVDKGVLKPYCVCGHLQGRVSGPPIRREDACSLELGDLGFGLQAAYLDDDMFPDEA